MQPGLPTGDRVVSLRAVDTPPALIALLFLSLLPRKRGKRGSRGSVVFAGVFQGVVRGISRRVRGSRGKQPLILLGCHACHACHAYLGYGRRRQVSIPCIDESFTPVPL
jgi:hypothetical protein